MTDDTADAVDRKPPEDVVKPRPRRRPSKLKAKGELASEGPDPGPTDKGATGRAEPSDGPDQAASGPQPDQAPPAGDSGEEGKGADSPKRPARPRSRKPPAKPGAEQAPVKGDKEAAPSAQTDRPTGSRPAPGSAAKGDKEAAPSAQTDRPIGSRPVPDSSAKSGNESTAPPDDKPEADAGPEAQPGNEDSSGGGPPPRSRRRRRSRRGSGGSQDSNADKDDKGDKGDKGPSQSKKGGGPDKDKTASSGDSDGGRPSRSGGGKRKRRSSRRPKLQDIAPLGPRKMLITLGPDRCQIAVLEGRELIEHYVAKTEDLSTVGNVYVGRVENVLPGMEAAFLDIGESRNAVLYVGEVSYDEDVDGRAPRIETLLKSGQSVVAQVTKDAMGSKGARLTTEVSLAGRYLVLVPDSDSLGISRRLSDNERRRLRDIASRIRPEGHGMIVRTAANGADEEDLERDMKRLVRIWNEAADKMEGAKPPKLVYAEPPLAIRVIRDLFTSDVEQVIVDDKDVYEEIREYLEEVAPDLSDRVEYYDDKMSLYERFHVMEQVRKAVDRKVWLASGGHIVIDRTEAMTVVDVNTGRFVGRSTLEDTVLHANLEAAEEIAKQLRLRDIGGIIVVDFIDMGFERNRDELIRVFENALLRDKTRTQVYGVSELGLVQMTRKKVSEGLVDAFSKPCETCSGRGLILIDMD